MKPTNTNTMSLKRYSVIITQNGDKFNLVFLDSHNPHPLNQHNYDATNLNDWTLVISRWVQTGVFSLDRNSKRFEPFVAFLDIGGESVEVLLPVTGIYIDPLRDYLANDESCVEFGIPARLVVSNDIVTLPQHLLDEAEEQFWNQYDRSIKERS